MPFLIQIPEMLKDCVRTAIEDNPYMNDEQIMRESIVLYGHYVQQLLDSNMRFAEVFRKTVTVVVEQERYNLSLKLRMH